MKRLIEIATGRDCGVYDDTYTPPANSVDANPALYRFETVAQDEIDAQRKQDKKRQILAQLADIDRRSIRALRTNDAIRLTALEDEAELLRQQLFVLG